MAEIFGRKVFILHPQSVIREEMLHLLIAAEYEVALLTDTQKTVRAIMKFPNSILYINIDDGMKAPEWEAFIRKLMENKKTDNTRIGILANNADPVLIKKYLTDVGVHCGFITLKLGLKESFKVFVKNLEANEAKGRRRYVRAICKPQDKAMFNIKVSGEYFSGTILDISSVGMACAFDKPHHLKPGTILDDIQLKLRAVLCKAAGQFVGIDKERGERLVVMFSDKISPRERHKIHQFVYNRFQETIDVL